MDVDGIVEEIFRLFEDYGEAEYIGEPVTTMQHMVQAAMLAEKEGACEEVVLSALLHDIGHLVGAKEGSKKMVTNGVVIGAHGHEKLGSDFLKKYNFPRRVTDPILHHVNVKRYLTYKKPEYYEKLSEASKNTLIHQGGPMSEEEALEFEAIPNLEDLIRVREWDEKAKDPDVNMPPLSYYKEMLRNYLTKLKKDLE